MALARELLPILGLLAVGCDGPVPTSDVGADAGGDACACSAGLASVCAGSSTCPPDLGSPAFDAWAEQKIASGFRPPTCVQAADCPELLMVVFGQGVDCADEYFFDATTQQLVALAHTCDGFALGGCKTASRCVPQRCAPSMLASYSTPASCPAFPDAGPADGGSADGGSPDSSPDGATD